MKAALLADWRIVGRPKQFAPPDPWTYWLILAGRGFGKTRSLCEWVRKRSLAEDDQRGALVAATLGDARDTLVEGESGMLAVLQPDELRGGTRDSAWNRSTGELYLANGTKLKTFASEKPDRLRGPQHHFAACDELSSWKDATKGDKLETTWSNLKLGARLGDNPQIGVATTPKPNLLTRELVVLAADPRVLRLVSGSSYENRDNLPEQWWNTIIAPYEGTRLGQQEIHAMLLEDVEGALWNTKLLEAVRVADVEPPGHELRLTRIMVAVDPNVSSGEAANEAGIIVCGATAHGQTGYVLEDATEQGGPHVWVAAAIAAYHRWQADGIVAEKNQGGELVEMVLKAADPTVPITLVHAARGKRPRAEAISTLYEQTPSRVRHAGYFPALESQMATWTPDAESPDRMDALVWGMTELLLNAVGPSSTSVPRGRIPVGASASTRRLPVGGQRRIA